MTQARVFCVNTMQYAIFLSENEKDKAKYRDYINIVSFVPRAVPSKGTKTFTGL